jgi:hypothetical protein
MLQELTVANAILIPDPGIYFAANLCTKMQLMLDVFPVIPMRIHTVTVYYDGKLTAGCEDLVDSYMGVDGRLLMKRQQANVSLCPF